MSFCNLTIKNEYRSRIDNMITDFYVPILGESVMYKRAVGFFSSTSLSNIAQGIAKLMENDGEMQLIASPSLSDEDVEAIKKGYFERRVIIENALLSSLQSPKDYFEEERLNLLANLIANGRLNIKIALIEKDNIGIFHEKMGLMYDNESNVIAFSGSMNESYMAFVKNYEAIDVFCSWTKDYDRVAAKESAFTSAWNNTEPGIEVLEFPSVTSEILRKYKRNDMPNMNIDYEAAQIKEEQFAEKSKELPCLPETPKLHEYQTDAIDQWENEGFKGIFDMATGTGKTLTGLSAIVRLSDYLNGNLAVFIVCPYQHLVEQWVEDIVKFNISPIIGYSSSPQKNWRTLLSDAVRNQKAGVKGKKFFCFICTNATYASKDVQGQIHKIKGNALLEVDEAHNFGATKLRQMLPRHFEYRLALSATLERHKDDEGTDSLKQYFGKKCIEYPLERAIKEEKLTPYKYYPVMVTLNDTELDKYTELSFEMSRNLTTGKNGKIKLNKYGELLAIKRARIVAAASSKIKKLEEKILPYSDKNYILVYCGAASMLQDEKDFTEVSDEDMRQIDVITDLLGNKLDMKVSQFTSRENIEERTVLKHEFSKGETLQALIAIKCLDEGVNIPNIKTAFILASTTNPKEYIQRRGRVLRLAPGKEYAEIYDFVTLPRPLSEVSGLTAEQIQRDLSLVKNELSRLEEFSRISMNAMEASSVIWEIRNAYRLYDEVITFESDF